MKATMICRLAATCLVMLMPAALAADENSGGQSGGGDGRSGGGDYVSASSSSSDGQSADPDRDDDVDADQDQARELVEHGDIRPLREVLERVRAASPGEVVGIAFAHRAGRWVYGLKVLTPTGRRVEISVDAKTLAILSGGR